MAIITPESVRNYPQGATVWAWRNVTQADTCAPLEIPIKADKTVQVKPSAVAGSFGGATVHVKGACEDADYDTLESAGTGAALSFTAADSKAILQHTPYLKPELEGATGTTKVDILVFAVGGR